MQTKPFVIRLRPEARQLLDAASEAERRSRASVVESLIRQHLAKYENPQSRLDRMLKNDRQA